jgi:hypothetical protein
MASAMLARPQGRLIVLERFGINKLQDSQRMAQVGINALAGVS